MEWKCQWSRLGFNVLYICDLEHSGFLILWCLIYCNKGNNNVFIIIIENLGNVYETICMLLSAINAEELFHYRIIFYSLLYILVLM